MFFFFKQIVPRGAGGQGNGQSSPTMSTMAKTPAAGEATDSTAMEMVELNCEKNSYNDKQMMLWKKRIEMKEKEKYIHLYYLHTYYMQSLLT